MVIASHQQTDKEDLGFLSSMSVHRNQHVQPRTELFAVIRKCLLQNTVDGELRRIEEALLRDPGHIAQQFLGVHR